MRVKIYSYDKEHEHNSFPAIFEISSFDVDDESGKIVLTCSSFNNYFESERRFSIYDIHGVLDDVYSTLLVLGYTDLTSFGNFIFNPEENNDEMDKENK